MPVSTSNNLCVLVFDASKSDLPLFCCYYSSPCAVLHCVDSGVVVRYRFEQRALVYYVVLCHVVPRFVTSHPNFCPL